MSLRIRISICLIAALYGSMTMAQRHRLEFTQDGDLPSKWLRSADLTAVERVPSECLRLIAELNAKGYLEASIDSCRTDSSLTTCHVTSGNVYRWVRISGSGIPVEIASEARFRERLYAGKPVAPKQVGRLLDDLLTVCENRGYPFAQVWLDSLQLTDSGLEATVMLDKGPLMRLDSVIVKGSAKTNMRYLQSSIGIKPGDLYNESLVIGVERRIRELPFVTQKQRPYVQFTPERTKLFLFLDARKASSMNGVLGIQPDPNTGRIGITGDLDLRLRNALRRGEAISLNWRSLQDQTQDLRIGLDLPYAFKTPFGLEGNLRLFKRDTTFLEVNARGGLNYLLSRGDRVTLFVNSKQSNRLGSNLVTAPGLADVNLVSYGLGLNRERFDYRFNPRRGTAFMLDGSVGRKRTSTAVFGPNEPAPEIRTIQYELNSRAVLHVPIKVRSTVRFAFQGATMINNDLYRNELFRIGGLQTLRGVNEQSILASSYAIGTVEYRFVYEENSNFFVFVDQGWWEDASQGNTLEDNPLGFGAGTTFETKAGLFSLTYALGREFNVPVSFRGGKFHFGFISLF